MNKKAREKSWCKPGAVFRNTVHKPLECAAAAPGIRCAEVSTTWHSNEQGSLSITANEACCRAAGQRLNSTEQPTEEQMRRGRCQLTAIDLRQRGPGSQGNKSSVSLRIAKDCVGSRSFFRLLCCLCVAGKVSFTMC